jgi:hypothetical protein
MFPLSHRAAVRLLQRLGELPVPPPTPRFVDDLGDDLEAIRCRLTQIRSRRTRFSDVFDRVDAAMRWTEPPK